MNEPRYNWDAMNAEDIRKQLAEIVGLCPDPSCAYCARLRGSQPPVQMTEPPTFAEIGQKIAEFIQSPNPAIQHLKKPQELTWATEYPTEPGYYWIRNYRLKRWTVEPTRLITDSQIVEIDSDFECYWPGLDAAIMDKHVVCAEWFGPIQPQEHTERELLTKFLDYIYHLLGNKPACYTAIDSFLQIRLPPADKEGK